VISEK